LASAWLIAVNSEASPAASCSKIPNLTPEFAAVGESIESRQNPLAAERIGRTASKDGNFQPAGFWILEATIWRNQLH
jgi:hypothetical protein